MLPDQRCLGKEKIADILMIPLAWNLGCGYQRPLRKVLDIHDNTTQGYAAAYLGSP
jgi:hypothetical protein